MPFANWKVLIPVLVVAATGRCLLDRYSERLGCRLAYSWKSDQNDTIETCENLVILRAKLVLDRENHVFHVVSYGLRENPCVLRVFREGSVENHVFSRVFLSFKDRDVIGAPFCGPFGCPLAGFGSQWPLWVLRGALPG